MQVKGLIDNLKLGIQELRQNDRFTKSELKTIFEKFEISAGVQDITLMHEKMKEYATVDEVQ
jgi:hypothetical protein